MRRARFSLIASAALTLLACSPSGFNTPTLLNKVRVLGIQAEPPQPALGESTTLRKLVYQPPPSPDGGAANTMVTGYDWSWCPLPMSATDPSQCPIDQAAADQLFAGIPGVPPLDLGHGDTATFTNPFPAAMLAPLCSGKFDGIPTLAAAATQMGQLAASGALSFSCKIAGFPITIQLTVHTITDNPQAPAADELKANFTVYLRITDDPNIPSNNNPHLDHIFLDGSENPLSDTGTQTVARNSSVAADITGLTLLGDSETLPDPNKVLPNTDPSSPQYPNSVLGPIPQTLAHANATEVLTVSWFAECGDFGKDGLGGRNTSYLGDSLNVNSTFENALQNTWNIPKDCVVGPTRFIVVVRDNRGGVNWTSGVVQVGTTGFGADGGPVDSPTTDDASDAIAPPDAEALDARQADVDQLIADAAAPDAAEVEIVDAPQESAP